MRTLISLLFAALALGLLAAAPARAQDNCEITSTCPPKPPRPRPTPTPPPPPSDPCNASWQRAERAGTLASYNTFLRSCPRHGKAATARRRVAGLQCDAQFVTASRAGTESALQGFINACGDHPKVTAARTQLSKARCEGQWQTAFADYTLDGFESFTRSCANSARISDARAAIGRIRANPLDIKGLPAPGTPIPRAGLTAESKDWATKCEALDMNACARLGYRFNVGVDAPVSLLWAKALYVRACAVKEPYACANLGGILNTASGRERDLARSALLAQLGCNLGAKHGCTNVGVFHENGTPLPYDLAKAVALYEQGCDQGRAGGSALGCLYAARFYESGRAPIARNPATALQLAEYGLKLEASNANLIDLRNRLRSAGASGVPVGSTAGNDPPAGSGTGLSAENRVLLDQCNRKDGPACHTLARFYETRNLAGDRPQARTLFEKSCLAGYALACLNASSAAALDSFGPYDFAAVREYFDRIPPANQIPGTGGFECNIRPFTCFAVAQEFYRPSKKPFGDRARAAQFARASCAGGELRGCNLLARLRMEGHPAELTEAQALEHFTTACNRGQHAAACNNLGKARETGFGLGGIRRRNIPLAALSYMTACGVGSGTSRNVQPDWPGGPSYGKAEGCYNLGRFFRDGISFGRDPAQADIHFKTACTLGHREACAAIRQRR